MLRNCVSLMVKMSPMTVSCRYVGRHGWNNRVNKPFFMEVNRRRQVVELDNQLKNKDEVARRSSFTDWNYSAELKALQARLNEKIDTKLLTQAMIMDSHVEMEKQKQIELGVEVNEAMVDNTDLASRGHEVVYKSLTRWLRGAYSTLPEEMIAEIRNYLMTDNMLADVAFHIGLREIVLSEEYPPSAASLRKCFEALVGALDSSSPDRARRLVTDILVSQLHGKEIQEICSESLTHPMRILTNILSNSGLEPPEPRLLFQTGPDTILASHLVGMYCNKQIIGQSYGETLEIAEEMAARDALRNIFQTAEFSPPKPFGEDVANESTEAHIALDKYSIKPQNIINC